jgi:hypothetical protein
VIEAVAPVALIFVPSHPGSVTDFAGACHFGLRRIDQTSAETLVMSAAKAATMVASITIITPAPRIGAT